MKKISLFVFILAPLFISQAYAAAPGGFLGLSIGYYDIFPENDGQTLNFRAEYRPNAPIFIKEIKPWAGLDMSADGAFWAGGGFLVDVKLTDHLYLSPSLGAGLYSPGNNNADLFYPLIFRSQFEVGYQFDSGSRLAFSFSHMSNCGLGDDNPGVEMLNLYYHIPLERFSSWRITDT